MSGMLRLNIVWFIKVLVSCILKSYCQYNYMVFIKNLVLNWCVELLLRIQLMTLSIVKLKYYFLKFHVLYIIIYRCLSRCSGHAYFQVYYKITLRICCTSTFLLLCVVYNHNNTHTYASMHIGLHARALALTHTICYRRLRIGLYNYIINCMYFCS